MSVTVHTSYDDQITHEAADDFDVIATGVLFVHDRTVNTTIAAYAPSAWASVVVTADDRKPLA